MPIPQAAATHNIAEVVTPSGAGGSVLSRIPETLRATLNPNARQRALHTAGCEIRFRLESPSATLRLHAREVLARQHGIGHAQVLFGDFSFTYVPVTADKPTTLEIAAPDYNALARAAPDPIFPPRLVRILLPTHTAITRIAIDGDIRPPTPGDAPARRVLIYGSSITQGTGSLTARESWAGRTAHLLRADLINLGFGGGCHCEPEMADYLATRDDFAFGILETGINMLDHEPAEADRRIRHLIRTVTAAHPEKPFFCLGVFPCREDVETDFRGRAHAIRQLVADTVRAIGSPNVHFIDGLGLLDLPTGMTVDLTHPSPAGMVQIAERLAPRIRETADLA